MNLKSVVGIPCGTMAVCLTPKTCDIYYSAINQNRVMLFAELEIIMLKKIIQVQKGKVHAFTSMCIYTNAKSGTV
jgi:hypothetical protein